MKRYIFKLLAHESETFGIVGNFIHIYAAVGDLTIKSNTGDMIVLPQQVSWHTEDIFQSLTIESEVNQTIMFYAGFGTIKDGRTVMAAGIDIAAGLNATTWFNFNLNYQQVAGDLLIDKNASRKELVISSSASSTSRISIAGSYTGVAQAPIVLSPGDTAIITDGCKGPWYYGSYSNQQIGYHERFGIACLNGYEVI